MKCFQHHDCDAVGSCRACNAGGCGECLTHYADAKMCFTCAQQLYQYRVGAARNQGEWAKKRLTRAAIVAGVFGSLGSLMSGSLAFAHGGFFAALLATMGGALWCAYVWSTAYLGIPPFMRFFGSRMTGGAISETPGGALFGALWFWVVAGWWLFFLGSIFAFCGGGVWQGVSLFLTMRRSNVDAASIPPPALLLAPAPGYFAPSLSA